MESTIPASSNAMTNNSEPNIEEINTLRGSSGSEYILEEILGQGTYGIVYKAHKKGDENIKYAIKRVHKNVHPAFCQMEVSVISYLNSKSNYDGILKVVDGNINEDDIFMVTEYFEFDKFTSTYANFTMEEIKHYMKRLLETLKELHGLGIVHRDIKPDNFLYHRETKKSMLIDFGLAELNKDLLQWSDPEHFMDEELIHDEDYHIMREIQKNEYRHRAGTRGFLAPEIIFKNKFQSTGVDIWSAGVIFLTFLMKVFPVFNMNPFCKLRSDNLRDIHPLALIYGRENVIKIAKKCKSVVYLPNLYEENKVEGGLLGLIKREDADEDAKDLLLKLMELDYEYRITAEDALKHPFFRGIG